MADRGEVRLREARIKNLIDIYKKSFRDISRTIVNATTAGKIQKAKTLATIRVQLTELGVNVDEWVKREIPQYYLDGANVAIQDLRDLGVDLRGSKGLVAVNKEAIASLVDSTNASFAEGLTGISRNARVILNDALKQQITFVIAEGTLKGQALRTITAGVKQRLAESGLTAIRDRAGRSWTFERYAEMLVRTKSVEARNAGLADKMLQNGYDLVQVSNHGSKHKACAIWEGKILSLHGITEGYATVDDAEEAGLFHPNCQHAINVIVPALANKTKAYDNPYNKK